MIFRARVIFRTISHFLIVRCAPASLHDDREICRGEKTSPTSFPFPASCILHTGISRKISWMMKSQNLAVIIFGTFLWQNTTSFQSWTVREESSAVLSHYYATGSRRKTEPWPMPTPTYKHMKKANVSAIMHVLPPLQNRYTQFVARKRDTAQLLFLLYMHMSMCTWK